MRAPAARLAPLVALVVAMNLDCARKDGGAGAGRGGGKEHVVLGVSALRISLPVFVALDRGLFATRGLDVEVRRFDSAQPMADELAAGRIDAGGYVAFPILFGREGAPPPVKVFSAIVEDAEHPISYLLVRKGSGLRGVASLRGRRIGILPTVAYRKWIDAILLHDGVPAGEATVMPVAPQLEVDALAGGGVDALFTGDPMATAALARGVAERATEGADVPRVLGSPFLFGTFAVSDGLAASRPGVVRALREALDAAIDQLEKEPALGGAAMAPYLREGERPFVARYPAARYLRSTELHAGQVDRALELVGSPVRAAGVALP